MFLWARLKLAGTFVLIIAVILAGFSLVLYESLSSNLVDTGEEIFTGAEARESFIDDTLESTSNEILLIDFIILMFSAGAGYVLAGYVLRPIQNSVEAQRMFSENASHELRTPLAVMKNDAEVLLLNPNPGNELVIETLKSMVEEIDHMTHMTEDLLLIARSDNRKLGELQKLDVTEVVKETAKKMQGIAKAKGILLDVRAQESIFIRGNRQMIERVLVNLLQNAVDHTQTTGEIIVSLMGEQREARISIRDNGTGIDPKDLPHIFERFYKGAGASGNGLGLSIVKELTHYNQGSISIESQKHKGTEGTLRFPKLD